MIIGNPILIGGGSSASASIFAYGGLSSTDTVHCVKGKLPYEYQELTYIESTGTQYIDVGFTPSQYGGVNIDVTLTPTDLSSHTDYYAVIGATSSGYYDSYLRFGNNGTLGCAGISDFSAGATVNTKYEIIFKASTSAQYLSFNGTTRTASASRTWASVNLFLFGQNNAGSFTTSTSFIGKLHHCAFYSDYDGTTLVRNFIPCYRKSDDVNGLYDTVNGVFYTNQGSGSDFTRGSEVTQTVVSGTWTSKTISGETVSGWLFSNITTLGTYTVSANNGTKTITSTVSVDTITDYDVQMNYYYVWGVDIDQSNSNPLSCCTYTDDAVGMTVGSSDWDTIFGYKPCLFVNGAVSAYLNPANYAQDEDGNTVDITTLGNDVMVEFPKMGYKISTSGDVVSIRLTNELDNSEYCYKPFSRSAIGDRDYFYYGAYKSYCSSSNMYSSSGKTPTGSQTRATYRTYATNRGTGYYQNGWYQLIYIQCLYLLKYKNLNSQSALGCGYVGGSATQTTGGANTLGVNYGNTSSQTDRLKLFGIEDFWGNIWSWVDGLTTDASRNLIVTHLPVNFDDATSGTAHTSYASGVSSDIENYLSKVQGSTDTGFAAKEVSGSDSTYYCDYANLYASCVARFGGMWGNALLAGAFRLYVAEASSGSHSYVTSRLMYV